MDRDQENIRALIVKLMFLLKKRYPFPHHLNPADINEEMFNQPNMKLMSLVLHYLFNVINPEKCELLVPHPLVAQSTHFNQGAMKFLTQTFIELPHIKIDGLRVSTLAASSGDRFEEFLARLVTNTVQLVYEKYGVVSIPSLTGIDSDDRLSLMQAKRDRAAQELSQQRHVSAKTIIDPSRYKEAFEKLKGTRERLKAKYDEVVVSCPSRYTEALGSSDPEQAVPVLKTWENDIRESFDVLSREYNAIRGDEPITASNEATILEGYNLFNSKNEAVIRKVAEDHNIQLFDGPALLLPEFLRCTSIISEKLNTLITNSKLKKSIECVLNLDTYLERLIELNSEENDCIVGIEKEIELLKASCRELQGIYDDLVAKGKIVQRYSYSRSFPNVHMMIGALHEPADLPLSPGNSWKEEVENVKRNRHKADSDTTPKLTRKRIDNSSISSLSRTVLQKQAWASSSRAADLTVGEMFQGPLSSSSPVNSAGDHAHIQSRRSISDIIDDISLLDTEMNEFLADISEMADTGEDSEQLSPDDTFGDSHSPKEFRSPHILQGTSQVQAPIEHVPAQSEISNPLPPRDLPKPVSRAPRPSLDAIVKRYAILRQKMKK